MAGTFSKRQKEQARLEKRQKKAERKRQREDEKLQRPNADPFDAMMETASSAQLEGFGGPEPETEVTTSSERHS